jgi:AAA+ superfamily predicted ATPase
MSAATPNPPAWTHLADATLRRAVMRRRVLAPESTLDELVLALPAYRPTALEKKIHSDAHKDVEKAREVLGREIAADSAFSTICHNAFLEAPAAEVLAILAAIEVDPFRQRLVRALVDRSAAGMTRGILNELLSEDHPHGLDPSDRLRRAALVHFGAESGYTDQSLRIAASAVSALRGEVIREPLLSGRLERSEATGNGTDRLLVLAGADKTVRRHRACELVAAYRVIQLDQPEDDAIWEAAIRLATLTGAALIVEVGENLHRTGQRWINEADHLTWVVSSNHDLPLSELPDRPWREVRVPDARPSDERLVGMLGPEFARGQRITFGQLELLERAVPGMENPERSLRRLASGELDRLATRIVPRRHWEDLVLDAGQTDQLRDVVRRFRHRNMVFEDWAFTPGGSVGVKVLLAGPPGTGKTMAAEIVAGELGLDLFRVNVATTVSKWVGETEKNLEAIFAAAEVADVVLLFDEADSIFGKRGDVSDANDRYANMETSYLLQRIERFNGVVVLTTNLANNIDQAFVRRIDVSITFPMPEEAERKRIWVASIPTTAPVGVIDFDFLASTFKIAGGAIKNVALTAAFLAAERGDPIGMGDLVTGLRRESAKMGRLMEASQFGPYAHLVV